MRAAISIASALVVLAGATAPDGREPGGAALEGSLADSGPVAEHGTFTGELLPVFFVRDVLVSVAFYRAAGFELRHFFDYDSGEQVPEWTKSEPAIWALMAAESFEFALHRTVNPDELVVGGMRHYFLVEDVDTHRRGVVARGIDAGDLIDRPWMRFFSVTDPDGHELFFGTRPDES
jgi:hypothetical protein